MFSILFAAGFAALMMVYWVFCRRVSLVHRANAARLLEEFFASEDEAESEKATIYWTYKWTRYWLFLPVMMLLAPLVLVVMVVSGDSPGTTRNSEKYNEIMESLMKMYMTRNPLTSMICAIPVVISFAIAVTIGLLLNRLKTIPSIVGVYSLAVDKASHGSRDAQVH